MKFRIGILGILILFICVCNAYTQGTWNLERCVMHALDNNIMIKQQELNTQYNNNNLLQSKVNLLPNLNASGAYSASFGRALDQTTYQFTDNQTIKSLSASFSSNLTVFNGFQKLNMIKQDHFNLLTSLKDLEKLRNDISLNVAAAYLQILFNMELLQVAKNQLAVTQLQVERTAKLVDAGSIPMGSLLEIQSQQASEELQQTNYQNQLDISYLTLSQILELDSVGNFRIEVPDFSKVGEEEIVASINEIYLDALNNLPQIKGAEYKLRSSEVGLDIARGGMSPRIFLSASYGSGYSDIREKPVKSNDSIVYPIGHTLAGDVVYSFKTPMSPSYTDYPLKMQLKDNASTTYSVGISLPIFNGWVVHNNISNSKINVINSRYTLESTKKTLYKDIQQAYADAVAGLKKYRSTQKALSSMRESFKYTEQKYEVGLVNTVDYYTSKNQLTRTESELLQAKYDYIFKSRILDFYRGRPLKL